MSPRHLAAWTTCAMPRCVSSVRTVAPSIAAHCGMVHVAQSRRIAGRLWLPRAHATSVQGACRIW